MTRIKKNTDKKGKTRQLHTTEPRVMFGERLRLVIRERGYETQADFSRQVGIDQMRLSSYLNGLYEPPLSLIATFCMVLNVSPNYLLLGCGSRDLWLAEEK